MKSRYLTLWGCVLLVASAFADDSAITREWLEKNYFRSIKAEGDQIVLRFKEGGERFYASVDGAEGTVNEYGGVLQIVLGQKLKLNSRHSSLEFTPLPSLLEKAGFLVSSRFDARSFGGEEKIRYGILLLLSGSSGRELRFIEPPPGFDPSLPPSDPTYRSILKTILETDPLARHELVGRISAGETAPPFPKTVEELHLRWEKKAGAPDEALEARWIAVDIGRPDMQNHVITTSVSPPQQNSGDFVLKKPTAGFPPGKYRVEIRQSEKTLFSKSFEITP
jgi:hypothetical protein